MIRNQTPPNHIMNDGELEKNKLRYDLNPSLHDSFVNNFRENPTQTASFKQKLAKKEKLQKYIHAACPEGNEKKKLQEGRGSSLNFRNHNQHQDPVIYVNGLKHQIEEK